MISPDKRRYRQFCGTARALDVVGERWTLLIVRNLLLGPRRYSDLLSELPGLTTNLLAVRLREMREHGLVESVSASGVREHYGLTARGAALERVIVELSRWGAGLMDAPREDDRIDVGLALLSLKPRYRGVEHEGTLLLKMDERAFTLHLGISALRVTDRALPYADARVTLTPIQLVGAVIRGGGPSLNQLRKDGALGFEGDKAVLRAFERAV